MTRLNAIRAESRIRSISGHSAIVASSSSATAGSSHLVSVITSRRRARATGAGWLANLESKTGAQHNTYCSVLKQAVCSMAPFLRGFRSGLSSAAFLASRLGLVRTTSIICSVPTVSRSPGQAWRRRLHVIQRDRSQWVTRLALIALRTSPLLREAVKQSVAAGGGKLGLTAAATDAVEFQERDHCRRGRFGHCGQASPSEFAA